MLKLIKLVVANTNSKSDSTTPSVVNTNVILNGSDESTRGTISKKELNFTVIILVLFLVYAVGNLIDSIGSFVYLFANDFFSKFLVFNTFGTVAFYLSHSIKFFIYFKFHRVFRKKFQQPIKMPCNK